VYDYDYEYAYNSFRKINNNNNNNNNNNKKQSKNNLCHKLCLGAIIRIKIVKKKRRIAIHHPTTVGVM
jgi:hypothetical protein